MFFVDVFWLIFQPGDSFLGLQVSPGHHFCDPGVPRVSKEDTQGSRVGFSLIFHPGDSFVGPQVIIFAIQGSPGSAKRIHRDPGLDFHRFFMDLGTLFRTCFEAVGSLFRDLRDTNSSIGFQVAFS